jgi:hydroxymethylglutaryl-CoA lyase
VSSGAKVMAALEAGCKRIDSALGGMGGCPFAKSTLVGNVSTEAIVDIFGALDREHHLNVAELTKANDIKLSVFGVGVKELVLASVLDNEKTFLDMCLRHFRSSDRDDVGYLNQERFVASLQAAYQELGEDAPREEKLLAKFAAMDISGNGRITFDEYMVGVRRGLKKRLSRM